MYHPKKDKYYTLFPPSIRGRHHKIETLRNSGGSRQYAQTRTVVSGFELVTCLSRDCCISLTIAAQPCHTRCAPNVKYFWPKLYQNLLPASACNKLGDAAVFLYFDGVFAFPSFSLELEIAPPVRFFFACPAMLVLFLMKMSCQRFGAFQ